MNFEQAVYCVTRTDGWVDVRRSVDRFIKYAKETQTKPLALLTSHTAVQVDCSISLSSTWRVSVVGTIRYAHRNEDIKVLSMRPTAFDFIHKMSVYECTASMALHGKASIETCFANWSPQNGVRGSERPKCVMAEKFYWWP